MGKSLRQHGICRVIDRPVRAISIKKADAPDKTGHDLAYENGPGRSRIGVNEVSQDQALAAAAMSFLTFSALAESSESFAFAR